MALQGIDLNLLMALDALLSEGNVTRAAERMHVGQPAMSAALARLRKHFDDPLLVKDGRTLAATPLAIQLAPLARTAVSAAESVFEKPNDFDPTVDERSFTVIASDYVTLVLLGQLMARMAVESPLQRISVVAVRNDFADHIRQGTADLLILPTELVGERDKLSRQNLFTDRWVLIADAGNTVIGDAVAPDLFTQLPYVAYDAGYLPSVSDTQLDELGISRRVEITTQSLVMAPFLVTGTPFVALVHARLATMLSAQTNLKILDPPAPLRPIDEAMFWHPRRTDDPAHRWLRQRIAEHAGQLSHPSGHRRGR